MLPSFALTTSSRPLAGAGGCLSLLPPQAASAFRIGALIRIAFDRFTRIHPIRKAGRNWPATKIQMKRGRGLFLIDHPQDAPSQRCPREVARLAVQRAEEQELGGQRGPALAALVQMRVDPPP